ncbi:MAG: hypothetical protein GY851_16840, partial [bacterium]|nr:hypothetical protein [bacterium]
TYGHLLDSHGPYFVTGVVQEEDHYCSVIVDTIEQVGHTPKTPGLSEITPPIRWLFGGPGDRLAENTIAHAD